MNLTLVDIGGTYIKCADGRQIPISSDGNREVIVAALRKALEMPGLVGVAIPGPFDYRTGTFLMKHKFAAVYGERFQDLIGQESPDIRFMHDVNAPLAGAIRMMGLRNAAIVTLGTGLGFSYAIDGKVQENQSGSPARSIWNLPCEGGILEDIVSARGIRIAYARKTGDGSQSAYSIAQRAYAGDIAAMDVYDNAGKILGEALEPLREELSFDTLLVGGQIAKSLSLMLKPLQAALPGLTILHAPENAVFEGLKTLFE